MARSVLLLVLFLIVAPLYAQKKVKKRPQKPLVVLNTNRSLNEAIARRAFLQKYRVNPSYFDSFAVKHRLRFIELYAEKYTTGKLAAHCITALYDLATQQLLSLKGVRINPNEKKPRMVYQNLALIDSLLKNENLNDFNVPFAIKNVYESDLGLYFDLQFKVQDTLIVSKIDYRFSNKKSRIIVYEK